MLYKYLARTFIHIRRHGMSSLSSKLIHILKNYLMTNFRKYLLGNKYFTESIKATTQNAWIDYINTSILCFVSQKSNLKIKDSNDTNSSEMYAPSYLFYCFISK